MPPIWPPMKQRDWQLIWQVWVAQSAFFVWGRLRQTQVALAPIMQRQRQLHRCGLACRFTLHMFVHLRALCTYFACGEMWRLWMVLRWPARSQSGSQWRHPTMEEWNQSFLDSPRRIDPNPGRTDNIGNYESFHKRCFRIDQFPRRGAMADCSSYICNFLGEGRERTKRSVSQNLHPLNVQLRFKYWNILYIN